ncbi:hypothetical protein GXP67_06125 [Rhodocytophaga rosea]|uniref:Uncharacterized protein n=1 Tax=Rhodocytophaga rosea TaxID=2704465 RepID=A0A6C0GEL6_9BACT|nr:hypothetical protein [Rhodocytophaga rosea]QHT66264.1 hypothetical protein GXP67_06125 [Rhodocytophaga rosea]
MKASHLFIIPLFILVEFPVWGQVVLVDKAFEYIKNKNIEKARESIDIASQHESTITDPRTWYLKSFIYKELYKANTSASDDFREIALESARKSLQLDKKNTFNADNEAIVNFLRSSYYNDATDHFNNKEFNEALSKFEKCIKYTFSNKIDEIYKQATFYAGYSSSQLKNLQKTKMYFEKALSLQYNDPSLYEELALLYMKEGNDTLSLSILESGRKLFPDNLQLSITGINLYLDANKLNQAEKLVNEYLQLDSSNIEVLLVAGTLYGKISQIDSTNSKNYFLKRKAVYERILRISPDNFTANYNMGITLYNRGVDLINPQVYDLDILAFHKLLENVTLLFKEALPYVEKAAKLSPENKNALVALQGIYYNINEKDKYEQIKVKVESMK